MDECENPRANSIVESRQSPEVRVSAKGMRMFVGKPHDGIHTVSR